MDNDNQPSDSGLDYFQTNPYGEENGFYTASVLVLSQGRYGKIMTNIQADPTHSQQLTNFVATIDVNQRNIKKKEQVGQQKQYSNGMRGNETKLGG